MGKKAQQNEIRVRIAPSPTGALHVGTAHTALFNFLFAKRYGGTFVLRVEDTDAARSTKEFEKNILEGLEWLGITWDEGLTPDGSGEMGDFGPYRQSERTKIYRQYLEKLLADGKAFYCWHAKEELEKEEKDAQAAGVAPKHVCAFHDTPLQNVTDEQKNKGIIRFKNESSRVIFNDIVHGDIDFDAGLLGDFSLARNIDSPLYNFAVVVDDYTTKISHIIRGVDHISNTPRQLMIQEALGFPRPIYAHVPLLLGKDRSKLSKRHAATSVFEYKEAGYLPEALFNFFALLGYAPEGEEEIFTPEKLIKDFSLERIQKSNAVFDTEKLDWVNGMYIRSMSTTDLSCECIPFLITAGLLLWENPKSQIPNPKQIQNSKFKIQNSGEVIGFNRIKKIVSLEQERMRRLTDLADHAKFFFEEPQYEWELLSWKKMAKDGIRGNIDWAYTFIEKLSGGQFEDAKSLEQVMMDGLPAGDRGAALWPLRAALSGEKASPSPFDIMAILGKEKTLARLKHAKELLK